MTRAEEFEQLRPLLFAIAYRILGSVSDAEDAVQETWLRYAASPAQPASGGRPTSGHGFLSRCWPTPTRTRSARRSWPTRYRWRPWCCSSV